MPRALRLTLGPELGEGPHDVVGGKVSLATRGEGLTKAPRESPVAATIAFTGKFISKVREDESEVRALAKLKGDLTLVEGRPTFVAAQGEDGGIGLELEPSLVSEEPIDTSKPRKRRRTLTLSFDKTQFRDLPRGGVGLRLLLPEDTPKFRFLELTAKLELAGAAEATEEQDDVLDVPITFDAPRPLPLFDLVCVDDVGKPLPGVSVVLTENGVDHELTSDDNGVVLFPMDAPAVASVEVTDLDALRDQLRGRWDSPRDGKRVQPNDTTDVSLLVDEDPLGVVIDTETPFCLSIQPYVFLARTVGVFFDTNKTFVLPSALPGMRQLRAIYDDNDPSTLLIVGHTDTVGDPKTNDPLSLDRARSVAAFLRDEPQSWLDQYQTSVPEGRRWGTHEDTLMASALPDFAPINETPVKWFERTRFPDGAPDKTTLRQKLVGEYMGLDGANVAEAGRDIDIVTHGCGENFPLDASGEKVDERAANEHEDAQDRRVELFFFDKKLGVQPKVADGSNSAKGSKQYPEWRARAQQLELVKAAGEPKNRHISVILLSNSACVPLANQKVTLSVVGEPAFDGTTDADGFFQSGPVPAGDHLLEIDGTATMVPATPFEIERRLHMVQGHVLLKATP